MNDFNATLNRIIGQMEAATDILREHERQYAAVHGAIIGAIAGGHLDHTPGYSKDLLLQIADILHIALPDEIVKAVGV